MDQTILHIDTHSPSAVGIKINGIDSTPAASTELMKERSVAGSLSKAYTLLPKFTAIEVYPGPGSYTGLRVGAMFSVVTSWCLDIPINGKTPGTVPTLVYEHDRWNSLK